MRKLWIAIGANFVAVIALWRLLFRKREELDWRGVAKPGRLIDLDGEAIHYIDQGKGPAVILIHGFGGHTYSYRYLLPELVRDHHVVALDLVGFGYSGRPEKGDYSHQAQARRVVGLMDAMGIEKASLVGHSMGGEIAMRVAAGWPERVKRIALVASVSGDRVPTLPVTPLVKPLLQIFSRLMGKRMLRASFYDKSKMANEIWETYHRPALIRGSMDGLYKIMQHTRKDPKIKYEEIVAPMLLMFAQHEKIVPGWMRNRLRKRFPDAETVVIDDAGHLLLEERPAECNAVLRRFLDAGGEESHAAERQAVDTLAEAP